MTQPKLTTAIATHIQDSITIPGANLVEDLIGQLTSTDMAFSQVRGRRPAALEPQGSAERAAKLAFKARCVEIVAPMSDLFVYHAKDSHHRQRDRHAVGLKRLFLNAYSVAGYTAPVSHLEDGIAANSG